MFEKWFLESEHEFDLSSLFTHDLFSSVIEFLEGEKIGKVERMMEIGRAMRSAELIESQIESFEDATQAMTFLEEIGEQTGRAEERAVTLLAEGEGPIVMKEGQFATMVRIVKKAVEREGGVAASRQVETVVEGWRVYGGLAEVLSEGLKWGEVSEEDLGRLEGVGGSVGERARVILEAKRIMAEAEREVARAQEEARASVSAAKDEAEKGIQRAKEEADERVREAEEKEKGMEARLSVLEEEHRVREEKRQRKREERRRQIVEKIEQKPLEGLFFELLGSNPSQNPVEAGIVNAKCSFCSDSSWHCILKPNNTNDCYTSTQSAPWFSLDFKSKSIVLAGYGIYPRHSDGDNPKSWIVEGSNDEAYWDTIDQQTNVTEFDRKSVTKGFVLKTIPKPYRYIKLTITETFNNHYYFQMARFEPFGVLQ